MKKSKAVNYELIFTSNHKLINASLMHKREFNAQIDNE